MAGQTVVVPLKIRTIGMMNPVYQTKGQSLRWLIQTIVVSSLIAPVWSLAVTPMPEAIATSTSTVAQAPTRPTLRLGSTGNAVSEVQAILLLLDYFEGPVDGQFRMDTESAVQAFQADVGLSDDGIVGPATWEKLLPTPSTEFTPPEVPAEVADTTDDTTEDAADEPVDLPTLRVGMTGPAVSRIQDTLRARGFYQGTVDGIFGPATEAAVQDFQSSVQLSPDGVVGPATWQALLQL